MVTREKQKIQHNKNVLELICGFAETYWVNIYSGDAWPRGTMRVETGFWGRTQLEGVRTHCSAFGTAGLETDSSVDVIVSDEAFYVIVLLI